MGTDGLGCCQEKIIPCDRCPSAWHTTEKCIERSAYCRLKTNYNSPVNIYIENGNLCKHYYFNFYVMFRMFMFNKNTFLLLHFSLLRLLPLILKFAKTTKHRNINYPQLSFHS